MASGRQTFDSAYFQFISEDLYNDLTEVGVSREQIRMMEVKRRERQKEMTPENFPYLTTKRIRQLREIGQATGMLRKENEMKRREAEEQMENLTLAKTRYPNLRQVNDNELRILMLGKTGGGKTATADTLCGQNSIFSPRSGSQSSAYNLTEDITEICGQKVRVIDTPGLFDTSMTNEDVLKIISQVITHWYKGIHAFLYVTNYASRRFTKEEKKTFELIEEEFGTSFLSHSVLVFTHGDLLLTDTYHNHPMTLQMYYNYETTKDTDMAKFLKRFEQRIVAIDNLNALKPVVKRNREILLQLVQEVSDAGSRMYTNEFFEIAQEQKANRQRDRGRNHIQLHIDKTRIQDLAFLYHRERQIPDDLRAAIMEIMHAEGYDSDSEIDALIEEMCEDERNIFKKVYDTILSWFRSLKDFATRQCTVM